MKKETGITLVALIITVVVLLIIASVSIINGTDSLNSTRLQGFYTELEIVQKRVDEIATTNESYVNDNNEVIYLKDTGTNLTEEQGDLVTSLEFDETKFKYFTSEDLKEILDISGVEQDVLIDFTNKIVVSANGIDIEGEKHYILESSMYSVEYNEEKKPTLNSLQYTVTEYGSKYKITISPDYTNLNNTEGYIKYVKYKKLKTKYWEISNNLEIIVEELGDYNIEYADVYGNTLSDQINISINTSTNILEIKLI